MNQGVIESFKEWLEGSELQYEKHADICEELNKTFRQKNQDYGGAYKLFGVPGLIIRIGDKFIRIISLGWFNRQSLVKHESLRDAFIDMANYCIIAAMMLGDEDDMERRREV